MARQILLIEDEEASAIFTQRILESMGYEMLWASNGFDGLNLVHTHQPVLVLLDIDLPDLDGKVVANRIRTSNKHIPIIAVTGYSSSTARKLALAYGCDDVLTKPLDVPAFTAKIDEYLSDPRPTDFQEVPF